MECNIFICNEVEMFALEAQIYRVTRTALRISNGHPLAINNWNVTTSDA
jgi:hypothetical protein